MPIAPGRTGAPRAIRRLSHLALAPLLLVAACAAGDSGTSQGTAGGADQTTAAPTGALPDASTTSVAEPDVDALLRARPLTVAHVQRTYVDPTRPTRAYDELPASDERTLVTELWYPTDAPGPVPLVVLAHGIAGHPDKFAELLEAWAAAGYAVAAPAFPLTSQGPTPGMGGNDLINQPADVSFVLDSVLAEMQAGGELAGIIDAERIGVAGMSLGGMTTYAVAFGDEQRDDRIDAAIVMASTPAIPVGEPDLRRGLPLLILHGSADPIFPVEAPQRAYDAAVAPRALVVLEGQAHFQPFEDAPSTVDEEVRSLTIAWWDRWLLGDAAAIDRLTAVVDGTEALTLQADLGDRRRDRSWAAPRSAPAGSGAARSVTGPPHRDGTGHGTWRDR